MLVLVPVPENYSSSYTLITVSPVIKDFSDHESTQREEVITLPLQNSKSGVVHELLNALKP